MRLHVLGLPHTQTTQAFSHCAFTGKVRRFAKMMKPLGYDCYHYGVGAPDSDGWAGYIPVMSPEEQAEMLPDRKPTDFIGGAPSGHLEDVFNMRLESILVSFVEQDDWICAPFGIGHLPALGRFGKQTIETGIGYTHGAFAAYRIYESSAVMHATIARESRKPWLTEWVVPNYFDADEWPMRPVDYQRASTRKSVLYLGRLTTDKGLDMVVEIARAMPHVLFTICGQGDPTPWLTLPNIVYLPPAIGRVRAELMHEQDVVICPSQYAEPFGGVAIEAMFAGIPALTSNHGAFLETMPEWCRCSELSEWVDRITTIANNGADEEEVRRDVDDRFSLSPVGALYDRIFQKLPGLARDGWRA